MEQDISNKFVRIGDMALIFRYANDGWTTFLSHEQMEQILSQNRVDQMLIKQLRDMRKGAGDGQG